jgi:hypothetical protein
VRWLGMPGSVQLLRWMRRAMARRGGPLRDSDPFDSLRVNR